MSITRSARASIFVLIALFSGAPASGAFDYETTSHEANEWRFKVYLDDKEIGSHVYHLSPIGELLRMHSVADFRVRFLFLTAYRYQHVNTEIWKGNCLQRIDAWTDDNGRQLEVAGIQEAEVFSVDVDGTKERMPKCVKTFAYWNRNLLDNPALLNAQTGELLPVQVVRLPDEKIVINGVGRSCQRFRLQSTNADIELWYGNDGDWLGLVSTTKDGRRIRYELT